MILALVALAIVATTVFCMWYFTRPIKEKDAGFSSEADWLAAETGKQPATKP